MLRVEYAELSLVGHREDNQDRVSVAVGEHAAFLLVIDGMGGHAEGARAAETALKAMLEASGTRRTRSLIPGFSAPDAGQGT